MFRGLGHDFKVAIRTVRSKPGFSLMVIALLALGVAGNTAMFSVFNGLFLRPWPIADIDRMVDIDETAPKWNLRFVHVAVPDYLAWQKDNTTFESMAFWDDGGFNLSSADGSSSRIDGVRVTHTLLDVLKLKPVIGRNITPEEDTFNGPKVVLLGHSLWERQFQSNPSIAGTIVKINGEPFTVIGVLPRDALYPPRGDIWVPLAPDTSQGGSWFLRGIGRMKPGVTIEQAQADLDRIHKAHIPTRSVNDVTSPLVMSMRDRFVGDYRTATRLLLGSVVILLLIACVNVASLMMVRASSRTREIAIRSALGAGRGAIIRQLLVESLLLALVGGVLGVFLGSLALKGLLRLVPDMFPAWISFPLDLRSALFCVAITGAAAIAFGLLPAIQASRVNSREWLQDGARSSWSRGRQRTLTALIAAEVALAFLLLAVSALLVRSFGKVINADAGFRPDGVMAFRIFMPDVRYGKPEQRIALIQSLLERLRAIPGVTSAGAASNLPVGEHSGWFAEVEGGWKPGKDDKNPVILEVVTTPGYMETMGVTLLKGRFFDDLDGENEGKRVVIVNETFAKQFWPGADPVGKRLKYGATDNKFIPVVGLTQDMKHYGMDQPMRPGIFVPMRQRSNPSMGIVMRTSGDPNLVVGPAREALRQLDVELPMANIRTMAERVERSLWFRRAYSLLIAVFAALATLLAAAGLYGVISYAVAQRTHEIGIRMALGAQPVQVIRGVLMRGLGMIGAGAVAGLIAAWATAPLADTLLFGITARDPLVFAVIFAAVLLIGLFASFLPARRAAGIDPMKTLRAE